MPFIVDEPMGASNVRIPGKRDNSPAAHVVGTVVGAILGGVTYMHRYPETDETPGLIESGFAADIPGSPDYRFVNATLGDSPIVSIDGLDNGKARTLVNDAGTDAWGIAYGTNGVVRWGPGWRPKQIYSGHDVDQAGRPVDVSVWRATR